MRKSIAIIITAITIMLIGISSVVFAENTDIISQNGTSQLIKIKENELISLEDYKISYGSDTYGLTAYILNKVRIYSIPLVFVGIAISAIYQYVIGIRKLDVRDKGFSTMVAIITIGVICQILPLIFAIVVKSGVS